MIEEPVEPRFEDDELVIETQSRTEVYDSKYLVAAALIFVAQGDGDISPAETQKMLVLVERHFELPSAESLQLLTRAMTDIAENPDLESLIRQLATILSPQDKEDVAVMMLEVIAADGAKDARSRAKEIARRILAEHEPTPINPGVDAWIKERFASSLVLVNSEK